MSRKAERRMYTTPPVAMSFRCERESINKSIAVILQHLEKNLA